MISESGCAGVMLARPFLYNPCIRRAAGNLKQLDIMKAFIAKCLKFDIVHQVIKYTLMEMIISRRHPPSVLKELSNATDMERCSTSDPLWALLTKAKSTKEICDAFNMQTDYVAVYGDGPAPSMRQEGRKPKRLHSSSDAGTLSADKKIRRESDTYSHPKHFSDDYFNLNPSDKDRNDPRTSDAVVLMPAAVEGGVHYEIVIASDIHAADIVRVTNEAYVVDKFFKKPEYYDRFSLADVQRMLKDPRSKFLVARSVKRWCHMW